VHILHVSSLFLQKKKKKKKEEKKSSLFMLEIKVYISNTRISYILYCLCHKKIKVLFHAVEEKLIRKEKVWRKLKDIFF
jgi:hypothetical protein